jgi:hypothetical protein
MPDFRDLYSSCLGPALSQLVSEHGDLSEAALRVLVGVIAEGGSVYMTRLIEGYQMSPRSVWRGQRQLTELGILVEGGGLGSWRIDPRWL